LHGAARVVHMALHPEVYEGPEALRKTAELYDAWPVSSICTRAGRLHVPRSGLFRI